VLFCTAFQICTPEDFTRMTTPRFRNTVGLNYVQDHTDHPLDATRGHILRSGVAWAAPFLGSDVTFTRWTGEGSVYRVIRPSWVGALSVRLGNFFQSASPNPERDDTDFLPHEERFYAGGANSVRGYARNQLGPGIYFARWAIPGAEGFTPAKTVDLEEAGDFENPYFVIDPTTGDTTRVLVECEDCVDFIPTGGTSIAVVNAEVRLPSPFFRRQLRLAAFVDAGSVSTGNLWDTSGWRVTPGVGLRIITPVGPARVDMAYNPYNLPRSALFVVNDEGQIVAAPNDFQVSTGGFFSKLKFHVAIGQAF
jgi:outer membrane protein assembly factor BamA